MAWESAEIRSIVGSYGANENEYMYFGVGWDTSTQKGYFARYRKYST